MKMWLEDSLFEIIQHTSAQQQLIVDMTGIDLKKLTSDYGYQITLEVDDESDQCIIHLGQTHNTSDFLVNLMVREEALKSQKSIEKMIAAILKQGNSKSPVYMEGFSWESVDRYQRLLDKFEKIIGKADNFMGDGNVAFYTTSGRVDIPMIEGVAPGSQAGRSG